MSGSVVKLITYIMLFVGFPIVIYLLFSVGFKSFNMFEWDTSTTPAFFLYCILNLVSIGIGIGRLNNEYN